MNYKIEATPEFKRELKRLAKKYQSLKNEFAELIMSLEQNPQLGTSIGKNCYKIRLSVASKGKGKSGGARVITYLYLERTTLFLLSIYDKSEKADISDTEMLRLLKNIE